MADAQWASHYQHTAGKRAILAVDTGASGCPGAANAGVGLSWEDLAWFAEDGSKAGKRVLHSLMGHVPAGQLMAALGPSGSGKTTLLDILAMRKTVGRTEGFVRVNGQERRPKGFQRASAFILQEDVMLPTLTVNETMWYYAEMVLPPTLTPSQKQNRVDEVLQLVGLPRAHSTLVGGVLPGGYGLHGLSSGERKRLSIAAATLLRPALVFADEPTTGIDAFASLMIVKVLKELAASGKTVIVTLHQPRDAVWKLFDQLYLLSEGRLLYTGPPAAAPLWFDSMGYQAPAGVSMADWLLDVVTIGFDKDELDWKCLATAEDVAAAAAKFAKSDVVARMRAEVAAAIVAADAEGRGHVRWPTLPSGQAPDGSAIAVVVPRSVQFRALLVRHALNYSRNLGNVVARLLLSLVAGLLVGVCYSGLRMEDGKDSRALANRVGSLFFCCLILMMSPNCSMGLFVADRRFYSVEAAAQLYSSICYYVPLALCELAVNLAAASLFWVPVYSLSGAGGDRGPEGFFWGLLACGLTQLCGSQVTNLCAMLLPNQELAFVTSVAINIASFIIAGFLIKTSNLPVCVAWMRFLSPVKFGFHALVLNEVAMRRFDVGLQLDHLGAALCEVGRSGCLRAGAQPSAAVTWWLRAQPLQGVTRAMLEEVLGSVDPCLLQGARDGQEALACLQLDEPSATAMLPSLVALLMQLLVLHLASWLALRLLHKERR